jgi:hypothetical protein
MTEVGFSIGCLYRTDMPLVKRARLYRSLGASAIELGFSRPGEAGDFKVSPNLVYEISKYDYVSLHAPWKGIVYKKDQTSDRLIADLKRISQRLPVKNIVLHPNVVEDFEYVEGTGLPFSIENMDRTKRSWNVPEDFNTLVKNYRFGFVLDLQHAYQKDPTMRTSDEFVSVFGSRLREIHVSGCNGCETHYPVHVSKNRDEICKILELGLEVPKILEGMLHGDVPSMASRELEFVRRYERSP